jgi:CheY-like chemotaxis protein
MTPVSIAGMSKRTIDHDSLSAVDGALPSSLPQLLIIEDSPDVILYLKSCLEESYQIVTAPNGRIGIEKAIEYIPDFIISDVMMPEKDGYEVCDTLKNDERTSHIPLILLTAKADVASRMSGLRRGADAYLSKPFDAEELLLQISVLLENRRRMAAHFSGTLQAGVLLTPGGPDLREDIRIENAFLEKVNSIMGGHFSDDNFALPDLCHHLGMSHSQLYRKMKAVIDKNPSDFIRSYRLNKAKLLLERGDISVSEATYQSGFKDPSYFSKLFQEEFGIQPSSLVST